MAIAKKGSKSSKRFSKKSVVALAVAAAAGALGFAQRASASIIYWNGVGTDWTSTADWSTASGATTPAPSAVPGSGDVATFSIYTITNTAQTVNLNAAQSVLGLNFLGTNAGTTLLEGGGTANQTLTLGISGIAIASGAGAVTIGSATANQGVAVLLNGNQSWANNASNIFTIVNNISNVGNATPFTLTLNGSGTGGSLLSGIISDGGATGKSSVVVNTTGGVTTLSGSNTFTGGVTLTAGTLTLGSTTALGAATSTFTIAGGALDSSVANLVIANNNPQNWNNSFTFVGSNNLNLGTGAVTLGASDTVTVNASTLTIGGVISGASFGLTKAGNGTLILSAKNTYTGGTTVNAGVLNLTNTLNNGASDIGTGTLTINAGATVTTSGDNAFGGATAANIPDININGGTLTSGSAGGLWFKGLWMTGGTVNGTGHLDFQSATTGITTLASANTATISVGTFALNSAAVFNVADGAAATDLLVTSVISGGSGLTKNGLGLMQLNSVNTYTGGTTVNAGTLVLNIGGSTGTIQGTLTINAGGTVVTAAGDAIGYGTPVSTLNINSGVLSNTSGGNEGYSTNFNLTGGTMTSTGGAYNFNTGFGISSFASSTQSLISGNISIRGGTLTINTAQGTAAGGDLKITSVISANGGSNVLKTGLGTLVLTGANTYNGGTTVSAGVLDLAGSGGTTGALTSSAITVLAGAELQLGAGDVLGYSNGNSLTLFGTLREISANSETLFRPITLSGGTITANTGAKNGSSYNLFGGVISTALNSGNSYITSPDGTFAIRINGSTYGSFNVAAGSNLNISAILANYNATDPLIKNGAGTMTLTGVNTYGDATQGTTLAAGVLNINANTALGNAAGTLTFTGNSTLQAGAANINLSTRALAIGAGVTGTVDTNGNTMTIGGVISGATGNLTKVGTGTLILSGASSYAGSTNVNVGQLAVTGSLAATAVSVAANATLAGSGTIGTGAGTTGVTLTAGVGAANQGNINLINGSVGTLTLQAAAGSTALTFGGAGTTVNTFGFDVGGTADQINVSSGTVTISGSGLNVVNVSGLGGLTGGTVTLISGALASAPTNTYANAFTLGTISGTVNGYSLTLGSTTSSLTLIETAIAAPTVAYFKGGINANWNAFSGVNGTNWTKDSAGSNDTNQLVGTATDVHFYATNATTGNLSTTLAQNFIINSLTVDGSTLSESNNVSISGNTLTIMAASNTYAAGTGIVVNSGAGSVTIASAVVLGGNQSWTNNSTNMMTVSGAISGSLSLTTAGSGTVNLLGDKTYTGPTIVNGGTLLVSGTNNGANAGIGHSSSLTINNGGTVQAGSNDNGLGGAGLALVTINAGGTLTTTTSTTNNLIGSLVLTGGTVAGPAPVGTGSSYGVWNLEKGLTAGGTTATSTISAQNVALSQIGGTVFNVASGATNGIDLNVTGYFGSPVNITNTALIKTGAGTMVLAGAGNTIAGLDAAAGNLVLSGNATVAATGVTVGDSTVNGGILGTLTIQGNAALTDSGNFLMGNQGTLTGAGTVNQTGGTVTVNDATAGDFRIGHWGTETSTYNLTGGVLNVPNISPVVSWDGNGVFNVNGGTATLKGLQIGHSSGNVTTGSVTLTSGAIILGSNGLTLSSNGANTTPTVNLNGGTLGASATWASSLAMGVGGPVTLDSSTFSITLSGVLSGGGSLTKVGSGLVTLSGQDSYSGGTTVSAGTLVLAGTANDFTASSGYSIASGATLQFNTNVRFASTNAQFTGAGTVLWTGTGTGFLANNTVKQMSFNMSAGGLLDVESGLLTSISTQAGNLSGLKIASGATASLNTSTNTGFSATTNFFDTLTGGGTLTLDGAGANRTVSLGANNGSGTFSGVIKDNTALLSLTKTGTGTQTLSGVSTYTGSTTISGGVLQISGAGLLGGGNYAAAIVDNASLAYASSANQTLSGSISGTGSVTEAGPGTLSLTASNSYSGVTTINGGAIVINADSGLGAVPGSATPGAIVINGGKLQANGSFNLSPNRGIALGPVGGTVIANTGVVGYAGIIANQSSAAGLTVGAAGATGTLVLSGSSTYSGGTTIAGGTLNFNSINALGTAGINFGGGALQWATGTTTDISTRTVTLNGGTMDINGSNVTLANAIGNGGTGGFTLNDSAAIKGTLTLPVANTYSGGTTVAAGTLLLANGTTGSATGTSLVTVASGATLMPSLSDGATIGGAVNLQGGGNISVASGTTPAGQLNITGSLTLNSNSSGTSPFLNFALGTPNGTSNALINVTGNLVTIGGTKLNISGAQPGTYDLIGFGATAATLSNFSINSNTAGYVGILTLTGNQLDLTETQSLFWSGNAGSGGNGSWDTSGSLNWANSIPAATSFSNGASVTFQDQYNIGAGNVPVTNNTVTLQSGGVSPAAVVFNNSAVNFTFKNTAGDLNGISGAAGGVALNGSGTVTFQSTNTYTGATVLNAGVLVISDNADLGSKIGTIAPVTFAGGTLRYATGATNTDISGRVVTLNTGGSTIDPNGNTVTYASSIGNAGTGGLIVNDTAAVKGKLVFTSANNYSGGTTVTAGTLQITPSTVQSGGLGLGTVTLGSGATLDFQILSNVNSTYNYANNFVLNGGTINSEDGDVHLATGAGVTIAVNNATVINREWGHVTAKALKLDGILQGSAALTLNGNAGGTAEGSSVWITNASNTYSGTVTVNANTGAGGFAMVDGANNALQFATVNLQGTRPVASTDAALLYGVQFSTGITAPIFAALQGNGNINLQDLSNTAVSLTTNGNNATTTFSGVLSGTGSLTKAGTGSLTLSGQSTFTGNINVNNGTLIASASAANNGSTGDLGAIGATRTITVASGDTLSFTSNNIFGTGVGTAASMPSIILNSGTLTSTRYNVIGNVTLNSGAALSQSSTDSGNYAGYQFLGTLTVAGTSGSTISTGNGSANDLGSNTTFNVGVTGSAVDLLVSTVLQNQSTDFGAAAGAFIKTGSGLMAMTAASTYSGGTTVTAGTLRIGNNANENATGLGTGTVTLTGGLLELAPGSTATVYNFANNFVLNGGTIWGHDGVQHIATGGATISVAAGGGTVQSTYTGKDVYLDGLLTGSGPLSISENNNPGNGANGVVHITNAGNTYSGTVTLNAATNQGEQLSVDSNTAVANATVNIVGTKGTTSGILYGTGVTTPTFGALSGTGNFALPTVSLTVGGNNNSTTYSGAIATGGGGGLIKTGTGTMVLSASQTYTGGTTVNAGVLELTYGGTGIGALLGTLTIGSAGTVVLGAHDVFGYTSPAVSLSTLNINGGTLDNQEGATNETVTGVTINLTGGTMASTTGGYYDMYQTGTYPNTTINTLASSTTSTISASLRLRETNPVITVASGTTPSGVDLLVTGVIQEAASYSLTKAGLGSMELTASNTYTGGTTVSAGKLIVANTTGSATGTGTVTISSGGTLAGSTTAGQGFISGKVNINSGGTLAAANLAQLTLSGGLTLNSDSNVGIGSTATFALNGTPNGTVNPLVNVSGGTFTANAPAVTTVNITSSGTPTPGTYDLIGYASGTISLGAFQLGSNVAGYTGKLVLGANQLDLLEGQIVTWTGNAGSAGSGNWDTISSNWATGTPTSAIYANPDAVTFQDANVLNGNANVTNVGVVVQAAGVNPLSIAFTNNNVNYTISNAIGGAGISGPASLIKSGTGMVILAGSNSYTGGTTVTAGILQANADHALGGNGTATTTTVTSGGELLLSNVAYGSTQNLSLAGTGLAGAGALAAAGTSSFAGNITLSDNSTFGVSSGNTLTLTGNINPNGQGLTLTGGGTININGSGINNIASGSTVDINGTTVNFNAGNGYGGTTTIENNGLLTLNNSGALPSAPTPGLMVESGGILDLHGYSGNVSGTTLSGGTITDTGIASTASLTTTGITVIGPGNVINAAVTGDLNFNDGASLSGTGTVTGVYTGPILGNNDTLSSTGTLTLDVVTVNGTGNRIAAGNVAATISTTIGTGASLAVNSGATLGGGGSVSVSPSGILSGAGTVHGLVDVQSGGHIAPGDSAVGTMAIDNLTLEGGAILDFEFNNTPANDFINVTAPGGLDITLGGGFNLYQEGNTGTFSTAGTYHLIGYNTSFSGSVSNLSVLNQQGGDSYTFVDNTSLHDIDLIITGPPHFSVPSPINLNLLLHGNIAAIVTNDGGGTGSYSAGNTTGLSIVSGQSGSLTPSATGRIVVALTDNGTPGSTSGSFTVTGPYNSQDVNINAVVGNAVANNTDYDYTHSVTMVPTPSQLSHNMNANGDPLFLAANALTADVSSGGSYAGLSSTVTSANNEGGHVGTTATFLAGTADSDKTVTMNWRNRSASETHPTQTVGPMAHPNEFLISDVVLVTGMGLNNVNDSLHVQTDIFALSMSYLPSDLPGNEVTVAGSGGLYLGWLSPTTNTWLNAVAGDFGGMSVSEGFQGAESFSTYFFNHSTLSNDLGAWGVDTTNHTVWAVLDHNSEFGVVVPEPTSLGMLGLGALGLLGRKRRKSRA